MATGINKTADEDVEGIGGVVGKAEMVTVISSEEPAQPPTGGIDQFFGFHCEVIAPSTRGGAFFQIKAQVPFEGTLRLGK